MERQFLTKKSKFSIDLASVNLEETSGYLKIQKSLQSENLAKYFRNISISFPLP